MASSSSSHSWYASGVQPSPVTQLGVRLMLTEPHDRIYTSSRDVTPGAGPEQWESRADPSDGGKGAMSRR
ncbi:MAG: hypothetical protein ACR2MZ_14400 [Candidatus Dormibacter sp.]|uniref:hypothetical protein n=1 Tax=Candidatus Dormibacter sp. TaxID=2973982 RepID=UPI003D9B2275